MKGAKRQRITDQRAVGTESAPLAISGLASDLVAFINRAWTPFHAVEEAARRLNLNGFKHIQEKDQWDLKPGGKYYFTRNFSTIVAFAIGSKYEAGNGFYMVGAHTDSPCLKLKPVTKSTKSGYLMVNVECYGGGLWYTWYDRDLGLAGRVLVKSKDQGDKMQHRLVKIDRPILRIPMLAIHLQRNIHTDGFKPNLQTNFAPILATTVKAQLGLNTPPPPPPADPLEEGKDPAAPVPAASSKGEATKHHTLLLDMIAAELSISTEEIVDFELNVCDVQPAAIGGAKEEFIFAGRLDNLAMSYCSLEALIESCKGEEDLAEETGVRAIALFDHEEVGSDSAQGAGGPVMRDTITRVATSLSRAGGGGEVEGLVERTMLASFLVSADMAHALHPNYSDKHDPDHQPKIHEGLVLKHNSNQRYATNSVSAALFREVGRNKGISCQEFSVRNDMPCGSTIGPILASNLGCKTVDVGIAQMSMHSIREMCGVEDVDIATCHFMAFFQDMSKLDKSLDVDSLPPPDILGVMADVPCQHVSHRLVNVPQSQ